MPETTESSTVDFDRDVQEMVADHAPRRFALVLEYGDQVDGKVHAWGLALDDAAYMTTVDGKNQYAMASADGALKYAPKRPGVTPRLVWVDVAADE